MALDTYGQVWNRVLLRCPSLSPKLAQDFVVNAFRRLAEVRRWSWLTKYGQFVNQPVYSTGTVNVTNLFTSVTGNGTAWTNALQGQQFRIGLTAPIYTVVNVLGPTSLILDQPFGGVTQSAVGYSIYQAFFTPPTDFHQFICLWDPAFNWQLYLDVNQAEINIWDAQRANTGNSYVVSFRDYTTAQVGIVSSPTQIVGTGAIPVSGGVFNAPSNCIFTVIITTTGSSGTAVFKWSKNNGSYTTGVTTDSLGNPQSLQDGVSVSFPTSVTYTSGDTFIISCTAISNAGLPRYELWPHQQAAHVYPFLYESRPTDLNDPNAVIPRYLPGNVLVDMALEDVTLYPGPSADKPNPYYSPRAAAYHRSRAMEQVNTLERQDDEVWVQNIQYSYPAMAWAMATPLGDARFLQSHAI